MVGGILKHPVVRYLTLIFLVLGGLATCHFNQLHRTSWVSSSPLTHPVNGSLWPSMVDDFSLDEDKALHTPAVQAQIHYYLSHKADLNRAIKKAEPYLFYIYQQTQKHHMPAEITLLPFIESGYSPFAYSERGAAGLWQMMPGTATGFGVTIDRWYDGRCDLAESTQAALNYLHYLYDYLHHDWLLAVAAYNSGEGTVREAIQKNKRHHKPIDFWSLTLPRETHYYVSKLLALSSIIAHREHYHLHLPTINNAPYLSCIKLNRSLHLDQLATLSRLPLDQLYQLNAGFKHKTTPPHKKISLLLPLEYATRLKKKLAELPLLKKAHYVISPRVTKHNNVLTDEETRPGPHLISYHVKHGDSLARIAHYYDATVKQVAFWNHLKYPYKLKKGQTITLWKYSTYYHVKPGDTLLGIALKFKCRLSTLRKNNGIEKGYEDFIRPGDRLTIK